MSRGCRRCVVCGGKGKSNAWRNRANLTFTLADGRAKDGAIRGAGAAKWEGTVSALDLKFADGAISGTVTATVDSKAYVLTLDGSIIGKAAGGGFKTAAGDKEIKAGRFQGTVTAVTTGK